MKCYICSHEVPEGKKCCPYCGRVITSSDKERYSQQNNAENPVYRPAGTKTASGDKTIHIPDLFSSDPNAPEYSDPHSYDRATADVLAYDRDFISRREDDADEPTKRIRTRGQEQDYENPSVDRQRTAKTEDYNDDDYYEDNYGDEDYYESEEEDVDRSPVTRDRKPSKPHLRFNVKMFIICIAVLAAIVMVVVFGYQIGEQFGIFGENTSGTGSGISADSEGGKKPEEPKSDDAVARPSSTHKTGKYTVVTDSNNIFAYKSETDPRIVATIPNGTSIEIVEISGDLGKTTYNGFTGWVKLSDLEFDSPAEPGSDEDTNNSGGSSDSSASTAGTYTVDLHGDGDSVNVRSENNSSSALLTTIPDGTELTVDKIEGNWAHITYDGIEGWVSMRYLMKQ